MSKLDGMLKQVDLLREELVNLEQALVRIPSVNTGFMPTGNETPVCEYINFRFYIVFMMTHKKDRNLDK